MSVSLSEIDTFILVSSISFPDLSATVLYALVAVSPTFLPISSTFSLKEVGG
jgi:hypothetical protein